MSNDRLFMLLGVALLMVAAVAMLLIVRAGPSDRQTENLGNSAISCVALGMVFSLLFNGQGQIVGFVILAAGLVLWAGSRRNAEALERRRRSSRRSSEFG